MAQKATQCQSVSQEVSSPLTVRRIDFLKELNAKSHHTSDFLTSALAVRRGQNFKIRLQLSRDLSPKDQVVIELSVGNQPLEAKGTLVLIPLRHEADIKPWGATVTQASNGQCEIELRTPPNAIVGKYSLNVNIGEDYDYGPEDSQFYLLFNPWCKGDDVYLPDEKALDEYVLNDVGYIYVGHVGDIKGRPWNFGQFEEGVLEVCMELLDKTKLSQPARSDPVKLSRAISALLNANDDDGVLVGNWSGKYPRGTSPLTWTGSSAILQEYGETHKPVKYGQCWVFSGVLTSVMRCLGIPARSVTNFNSAHDTDGNLVIDIYINKDGERMDEKNYDSVWNFHVWNDVWMKRPELPEGFDGWQAVDATPQETSGGIFQCGPSPLKAIKQGQIHLPHDTPFVFAEVNADRVLWREEGPKKFTKVKTKTDTVGKKISTKALGQDDREDITLQYKFPEGSEEERRIFERASKITLEAGPGELNNQLLLELKSAAPTNLGSTVNLSLDAISQLQSPVAVTVTVAAQLRTYDGKHVATVKSLKKEVTIEAEKSTSFPVEIPADDYMSHMAKVKDNLLLEVNAVAECAEPAIICSEDFTSSFVYPSLKVELPEVAKYGEQFSGVFTFKNTTGVSMDNCKLLVEGLGLFKLATFDKGNLANGRIFQSEILCTPYRYGRRKIVSRIVSDQVSDITAEAFIVVK